MLLLLMLLELQDGGHLLGKRCRWLGERYGLVLGLSLGLNACDLVHELLLLGRELHVHDERRC